MHYKSPCVEVWFVPPWLMRNTSAHIQVLSGCEEVENRTLQLVEPSNFPHLATPLSYANFNSQPHKY